MKALRRVLTAILMCCALLPVEAQERPAGRPQTRYFVVVPGMVANTPLILNYRSTGLTLVVSDLIMGQGEARNIPTPARAVMELRGGSVITTINGERTRRVQGDIWRISRGDKLSIENPYDSAVIRAMVILERGR
jgi:hypothetical protein